MHEGLPDAPRSKTCVTTLVPSCTPLLLLLRWSTCTAWISFIATSSSRTFSSTEVERPTPSLWTLDSALTSRTEDCFTYFVVRVFMWRTAVNLQIHQVDLSISVLPLEDWRKYPKDETPTMVQTTEYDQSKYKTDMVWTGPRQRRLKN